MTAQQKTNIIAAWIVSSGLVSTLIIGIAGGHVNMTKESLSISISVVTAFALVKRANWARWLIGVGVALGLFLSLFVLFEWKFFVRAFSPWAGVWVLLVTGVSIWILYTMFFDRQFVAYFKGKNTPAPFDDKKAEGTDGDAEGAV